MSTKTLRGVLCFLLVSGCSHESKPTRPNGSIAVTPSYSRLEVGHALQFAARIIGQSDQTVSWSVSGSPGHGTIDSLGLYTAPSTVPDPASVAIIAKSHADSSLVGTAWVVVLDASIHVTVTPQQAVVRLGQSEQFQAQVSGTTDGGVDWTVDGGAGNGTIDSLGLYTAPAALPEPPVATVRATSRVDRTRGATAAVTIMAPDTIPPAQVTDLEVKAVTRGTVTLEWTAVGDDSLAGTAAGYDLRYAVGTITPQTWADATPAGDSDVPQAAGKTESYVVNGLAVGQEYAFALKVVDDVQNRSAMSNVVTASIPDFAPYQLTFNQTYYGAFQPDWSPDGSKIAFAMGVNLGPDMTRPQLHVVASGGGQPIRYTSFTPEGAHDPVWSRDGQRFYFLKLLPVQNVYTKAVLAVMDAVPDANYTVLASYGLENVGSLALSPDGNRVAYSVGNNTPGQPVSQAIYTNSTAGNDPHVLVSNIAVADLDWSPDGTQIVYSMKLNDVYNLWVVPSGGGATTQLTTGEDSKWSCAWSPDGSEIAYASAGTIWAIPPSGGEPRRITTDSSDVDWGIHGISWSPDGTKMAYEKYVGSISNIWITTVN